MKPLFYTSVIINANKRSQEIADFLFITTKSWKKYFNIFLKKGLARLDEKGNLILCSWKKLCEIYKIENKGKKSFCYYDHDYKNTEYLIRTNLIKQNTEKQKATFYKKFFLYVIWTETTEGLIKSGNPHKAETLERFSKGLPANFWNRKANKIRFKQFTEDTATLQRAVKMMEADYKSGKLPKFNPIFTCSCEKVAKLFNRKAVSTGFYWEQRLEKLGYISTLTTDIKVNAALEMEETLGAYSYKKKYTTGRFYFLRTPNQILFNI